MDTNKMSEYGVPEYMHDGLNLYIEHGIQPGDFLLAVLMNDLKEAVGRADHINMYALPQYIRFLYNEAPLGCWGSVENVKGWIWAGGLSGIANQVRNKLDNSRPKARELAG